MRTLRIVSIVLLLGGCASKQVGLTLHAEPVGAYISSVLARDSGYGIAPQRVVYDKAVLKPDGEGCALVAGFVARWVSGAITEVPELRLCYTDGDERMFILRRDPAVPGFERDMQFAVQVQTMWAQQQAAIAAGQAAEAANAAASAALVNAINASQPVRCRTIQVRNSLQTTCN